MKHLFGNKRSNFDLVPRYRYGQRWPSIHDFIEINTASREWRAFASSALK